MFNYKIEKLINDNKYLNNIIDYLNIDQNLKIDLINQFNQESSEINIFIEKLNNFLFKQYNYKYSFN